MASAEKRTVIEEYHDSWKDFVSGLTSEISSMISGDDSDTLYSGELSPGCRYCKDGSWDCIFITGKCNLDCSFCISPKPFRMQTPSSAFGKDFDEIIERYKKTGIRGISFSGGEPFLCSGEIVWWFEKLKSVFPDNHFWIYTNGLPVTKDHIDFLAGAGLDELRFNTAATGYNNPEVLEKIEYASKKLRAVTVEIPVIHADHQKLIPALADWANAGVKYLNLHELLKEENSNSFSLEDTDTEIVLPDGHTTRICPDSRILIREICRTIKEKHISLHPNVCSLANKIRQVKGRRNNLGRICRKDYEKSEGGEFLVTICVFKSGSDYIFIHPDEFEQKRDMFRGQEFYRLTRYIPLSVYRETSYFKKERIL